MPFKGQIAAQLKKCHANEIFGGLRVEDSEEEKQRILLDDMVLHSFFFFPVQPLAKYQIRAPCPVMSD